MWIKEGDLLEERKPTKKMTDAFVLAVAKTLELENTSLDFKNDILTFAYSRLAKAKFAGSRV